MASEGLTGSRIRERRTIRGQRQADLARKVGISASYLNLIEHNRRRIGGKLLLDIAAALEVEPQALTQGAEAALVASLREAGEAAELAQNEAEKAEEFAGRFPGWADTLARAHRRAATLERTVETLSDRMAHDPQLAASLYELLSTAAAIRSTAAILAETEDLDHSLVQRFHQNMDQDSRRLSDSAKLLVQFLDADPAETSASPLEEVEAFLEANDYSFPTLETGEENVASITSRLKADMSDGAKRLAGATLNSIAEDAARLSVGDLAHAVQKIGLDPVTLAKHFSVSVACVMRRLAAVPEFALGLVICDRSGSFVFRKPVEDFTIPRFGSACALWPLYEAFSVPGQVIRRKTAQLGRTRAHFETYAIAEPVGLGHYNTAPLLQSTMLVVPLSSSQTTDSDEPFAEIGTTCRICPRQGCEGRRDPTILSTRQ